MAWRFFTIRRPGWSIVGFSRRNLHVWHHPSYRLPLTSVEPRVGIEPRRADLALWYLLESGAARRGRIHEPPRVRYEDLARIHETAYLESLVHSDTLGRIFGVESWDIPVDELLKTIRLACGGTLEAARSTIRYGNPHLNLLGGFHHAMPHRGSGLCALNDIAVAVATLRADGFSGNISILDLDAHPPDGIAACLENQHRCWLGSLSCTPWDSQGRADETLLPQACGDQPYLKALDALLSRMPPSELVFVIAGGDVLRGDRLGTLDLSPKGARLRDLHVLQAIGKTPNVWLPGGGYHPASWKPLAGTGLALALGSRRPIRDDADPLTSHFARISAGLHLDPSTSENQGESALLTAEDLEESLGLAGTRPHRLLGTYTSENIEYSLYSFGILPHITRLGYSPLKVQTDSTSTGDRIRLWGWSDGQKHLLMECVLESCRIDESSLLYVHWLTLRNPKAPFAVSRPRLPGQEVPGLGLAREAGELLVRMAHRLDLDGLGFRPGWYHVAYTARYRFKMSDPTRQGRFEALTRDLGHLPLLHVTRAIAKGRVLMNGQPYRWEPALMVMYFQRPAMYDERVEVERGSVKFCLAEPAERP